MPYVLSSFGYLLKYKNYNEAYMVLNYYLQLGTQKTKVERQFLRKYELSKTTNTNKAINNI